MLTYSAILFGKKSSKIFIEKTVHLFQTEEQISKINVLCHRNVIDNMHSLTGNCIILLSLEYKYINLKINEYINKSK